MKRFLKLVGLLSQILFYLLLFSSCNQSSTINPEGTPQTPPIIAEPNPTPSLPIPEIKVIQTLSGHESNITNTFAISSEGVLALQKGNYVHFIDAYTGNLLHTEVEKDDILYGVGAIIFSPDGNLMVNNHEDSASVWNVNEQKVLYTLNENITSFSEDGQYLNGNNSIFYSSNGQIFFEKESFLTQFVSNYDSFYSSITGPIFSDDRSVFALIYWVEQESIIEVRKTSDYQLLQTIPDTSIKSWESPQLRFNSANTTLVTSHVASPSSDNPTLVTKIWELETLEILNSSTKQPPYEILVNSKEDVLVILNDTSTEFVSLNTGNLLYTLPTNSFVSNVAFSPDGNTLIINQNTYLEIRNVDDGTLRYRINASEGTYLYDSVISFSPDSSKFTFDQFNENIVYKLSDGKVLQKFSTQTTSFTGLRETTYDDFRFMPNSNSVLAMRKKRPINEQQYDDNFIVFNIGSGSEIASFTSGPIDHAEFTLSKDGTILASFNDYPSYFQNSNSSIPVHIWDFSDGTLLDKIMNQNPTNISGVLISPDNQTLVTHRTTVSNHEHLDFWNINTKKWLFEVPKTSNNYGFNTDSRSFYIGTDQYSIETTTKNSFSIVNHPFTYSARNTDNSILVTSGRVYSETYPYTDFTRDVNIWKIADGQNIQSFTNAEGRVSPDGEFLAMFDYNKSSLELRQINTGQKIYTLLDNVDNASFYNYDNFYHISAFSSDSSSFFYQINQNKFMIWDTVTGDVKQTINLDQGTIDKIHLSPDGSFATVAARLEIGPYQYREELGLWRIADGTQIKVFQDLVAMGSDRYSVEFSPDGTKLVIGLGHVDYGNTITIYGNENNEVTFLNQSD